MANIKFKGRKKGSVNNTTIKDELMEPYYIVKNQYGFTVNEVVSVGDEDNKNKSTKVSPVGYFSNFGGALKCIIKEQLNENKKTYYSLKEYFTEWNDIQEKLESTINIKK